MTNWILDYEDNEHTKDLRLKMVQEQLASRGIRDLQVLEAMAKVPRHFFLPAEYRDLSYSDRALPIGYSQTISQPYMVALMSQSLQLGKDQNKVLEIGTGSGYQTAILCEMRASVMSIERIEPLAKGAAYLLEKLGYSPQIFVGDGSQDLPKEKYDAILVAAAVPSLPEIYLEHLNPGGSLVIPVGDRSRQILKKYSCPHGKVLEENIVRCIFVPLIGAYGFSQEDVDV